VVLTKIGGIHEVHLQNKIKVELFDHIGAWLDIDENDKQLEEKLNRVLSKHYVENKIEKESLI